MKSIQTGFSLIELMIVVAVIGIISSIAVPTYLNYIESSEYAAADSHLNSLILFQDSHHLSNSTYVAGTMIGNNTSNDLYQVLNFRPGTNAENYTYEVKACSGGSIDECYEAAVFPTEHPQYKVTYVKTP